METIIFLWHLLTDYRFHSIGYSSQNSGISSGSLNSNVTEIRKNTLTRLHNLSKLRWQDENSMPTCINQSLNSSKQMAPKEHGALITHN